MVHFFVFLKKKCFVVPISDLVHDVVAMFYLP